MQKKKIRTFVSKLIPLKADRADQVDTCIKCKYTLEILVKNLLNFKSAIEFDSKSHRKLLK